MPIYNKAEIERAAQQYGFVRDTFEKVLRLKDIYKYLKEEDSTERGLITFYDTDEGQTFITEHFITSQSQNRLF